MRKRTKFLMFGGAALLLSGVATFVGKTLGGCWHSRLSFPLTPNKKLKAAPAAAALTGTYRVCLDCGKEFPYDWKTKKTLELKAQQRRYTERIEERAARHVDPHYVGLVP